MKKKEKTRRRRWPKVLLIIFLILVIGLAALYIWQKNNIDAVVNYLSYSQEELEVKIQENNQDIQSALEDALETAREIDAKNAEEEAEVPEEETSQTDTGQQKPVEKKPTYEELLQDIVDRVYALRTEYVNALEALEDEAVAAYQQIPVEKRSGKYLVDFASTYISKASDFESECDDKMDGLVAELEALQKQYGQGSDLVDQVIDTYANEKSLKKAWYMAELEKRGMI